MELDSNWLDFDNETKRYNVVRALAVNRELQRRKVLKGAPYYLLETLGMFPAGLNLWSVLVFHGFCAVYCACALIYAPNRATIRQDVTGLRIVKILKVAISYVHQDSLGTSAMVSTEKRIAALPREAARLSIA